MGRRELRHRASGRATSHVRRCWSRRWEGSSTQAHPIGYNNGSFGRCTHAGARWGATQTTWAMAAWVRQESPVKALALLIATTVIFRCDTVLLLAPVALMMLIRRQLAATLLASVGQARVPPALVTGVRRANRLSCLDVAQRIGRNARGGWAAVRRFLTAAATRSHRCFGYVCALVRCRWQLPCCWTHGCGIASCCGQRARCYGSTRPSTRAQSTAPCRSIGTSPAHCPRRCWRLHCWCPWAHGSTGMPHPRTRPQLETVQRRRLATLAIRGCGGPWQM